MLLDAKDHMANHHLKIESWVNIENNNFPEQKFLENSTGVRNLKRVVDGLLKQ